MFRGRFLGAWEDWSVSVESSEPLLHAAFNANGVIVLKVLCVSTFDISGGAARAAYRLHQAFLSSGIDSEMLVEQKASDDHRVRCPSTTFQNKLRYLRRIMDDLPLRKYPHKSVTHFSPAWVPSPGVVRAINDSGADVVNLHWVSYGMLRIEDIAKITKPIVWTLHDMWAFTGGCHYDESCSKYRESCGSCPVLKSEKDNDLSRSIWKRKQKAFAALVGASGSDANRSGMQVVTPSHWLGECARRSSLMKSLPIHTIGYPLELDRFTPRSKAVARDILGLPQGRKLIAFGALGGTKDPRKGWEYLKSALEVIANEDEAVDCVVFGQSRPEHLPEFGMDSHWMGHLHDDVTISLVFAAADVMIVPSLQDNLPQTSVEAQACGCPVVAFDQGGLPDIVSHEETGYLAEYKNSHDLAKGIKWVLSGNQPDLRENARKRALGQFDPDQIAKKYLELFRAAVS